MKRFLLLAGLSLAAHLYGISSPPLDYHWHRQVNTAAIARNYHEGAPFLEPRIDWNGNSARRAATEFPLYMYLVGALWSLFGLAELWGRVLSAGFSAATAIAMYVFWRRWIPEKAAFAGGLFFSVIPIEVYFGRTIQPEALALFCGLAGVLALDRYLAGDRFAWLPAAWLGMSLSIGHKIPYIYLLGVCGILAWARRGAASLRDPALLAFFPAVVLAVLAWYTHASVGDYVVPTRLSAYLGLLDYGRLPYYVKFQFLSRFPELAVGWACMPFWIAGAWESRSLPEKSRRLLWGWFGCVALYAALGGGYVHHHEYTALPWVLVNAPILGLGLSYLKSAAERLPGPRRRAALAGVAALVLAAPAGTAGRIGHWYRVRDADLPSMAAPVARISSPEDLFLCNERANSVILYHIRRRGWSQSLEEVDDPAGWIDERIAKGGRYYMTRRAGLFSDRAHPRARLLLDRYPLAYQDERWLIFDLRG